ncbi:NmrA-like family [Fragilaria crotonensis]|nr:NmrA-like family [Fragilaria crotonensis]
MDQITIALIGATGRTGSEFLKLALEEGYCIKALVRTPSKVTIRNSRLQLIHGDLDDVNALEKLADGATYVVCMAAATMVDVVYPKVHAPLRAAPISNPPKSQPQVFLYQAGVCPLMERDFFIQWHGR